MCNALHNKNFEVVGVENDESGYNVCKSAYPQIPFYHYGVQDSSQELLKSEAYFDVVISTEVIEHLYSPNLLLQYANEVLVNEGFLIVSTPYHGYIKNLALSILNKWDFHHGSLSNGGHIKFWSKNTLTILFERNDFQVLNFHGAGRAPYMWKSMILVAKKFRPQ